MPAGGIRRASEMALVCVRPCVGLCEWEPKGGEVPDTTGVPAGVAHYLARAGVSRWLEGWAGDKRKVFNRNDPPGIPHRLVTPQWRGWARWPLSLWSSLSCVSIVSGILYQFHTSTLYGCQWALIQSSESRLKTKYGGNGHNFKFYCSILDVLCRKYRQLFPVRCFYVKTKSLCFSTGKYSIKFPFMLFSSWLLCWYFTPSLTNRRHTGVCWINNQRWVGEPSITVIVTA